MEQNFIYAPETAVQREFRCRVPMKGTRQVFVVDGGVQGTGRPLKISLNDGDTLPELLQVISVRTDGSPAEISCTGEFHFGRNSSGKVLLCSHTFSPSPFLTREKVTVRLEERALADFTIMQNEHDGATHDTVYEIHIAAGAAVKMNFITLHGGAISNDITVHLEGEHAECDLNGLYLVDGRQRVKNRVHLKHTVPGCTSRQLFKGILDDRSCAEFRGLIEVAPDAQKTEAYQANHHLLLSNEARAWSEPQLEIYADDVKCSHGATNGRLDEDGLFYLRTRGISLKEARLLQQMAFACEVLDKITTGELRERMTVLTGQRLRGEFSDCRNCSRNCC